MVPFVPVLRGRWYVLWSLLRSTLALSGQCLQHGAACAVAVLLGVGEGVLQVVCVHVCMHTGYSYWSCLHSSVFGGGGQ